MWLRENHDLPNECLEYMQTCFENDTLKMANQKAIVASQYTGRKLYDYIQPAIIYLPEYTVIVFYTMLYNSWNN